MIRLVWLVALAAFATACAIGNTHDYRNVLAEVPLNGSGEVAIATLDQRPYVVAGDKGPQFVGLQRGGFGNPFDVTTQSRGPLAEDFTNSLRASLEARGFHGVPIAIAVGTEEQAAVAKLRGTAARRGILLILREWKTDTMMATALLYDVTLGVYDDQGTLLASRTSKGKDDLGGSAMNPPAHAKKAVPEETRRKLVELLSDDDIRKALEQ